MVGVEVAEGIDEACIQKLLQLAALFVSEACIAAVGLGVLQVNLLVRYIEVAADDDGLLRIQPLEVRAEGVFPGHAVVEATEVVLRIRCVDRNEEEFGILEGDDATLLVVLLDTDAVADAERLVAGVDSGTRITFLHGIVPVANVSGQVGIKLTRLHLRLL